MPESIEAPEAPKVIIPQGDPNWSAQKLGEKYAALSASKRPVDEGDGPVKEPPAQKEEPKSTESVETDKKEAPPAAPAEDVKPAEKPSSALEAALGEEKPAEEKKPDIDVEAELAALSKIDVPKSEHWKRARAVIDRQKEELATLRTAPKPAVDPNAEAIAKENAELKAKIERQEAGLKAIKVEYSDEFQMLLAEREKAVAKVANKMKYSNATEKIDDLIGALNMPEGKLKATAIKEILLDMEPDDKIVVRGLIERVDEADEKIGEFRKDLPGQYDRLQQQAELQTREQSEQEAKLLETEFRKVVDELPKEIIRLRQLGEDLPDSQQWNEPIPKAIEGAFALLKPNGAPDFKKTVVTAIKGQLYDAVWESYITEHKELREARARLKEFDAAGPDFKGGKPPVGKPASKTAATAQDYEDAYFAADRARRAAGSAP